MEHNSLNTAPPSAEPAAAKRPYIAPIIARLPSTNPRGNKPYTAQVEGTSSCCGMMYQYGRS